MNSYDAIIIGCGPAGLSAAIYLARANLKTAVFGIMQNSNLYKAHFLENYFGFSDGITGPELLLQGRQQAQKFKAEFFEKEIIDIKPLPEKNGFEVKDKDGILYFASNLIFTTGLSRKKSLIENEDHYVGKGVSYCAICDGFFFKDKRLAVIGNKEYAAEEALVLSDYSKDITIISHGSKFEISEPMLELLKSHDIKLEESEMIKSFSGDVKVEKIIFKNGQEKSIDGVFMALGHAGSADFARKLGLPTDNGYLKISDKGGTNYEGIYAAGDCTGSDAQVAVSVGQGCSAALSIIKKMKKLENYLQYG